MRRGLALLIVLALPRAAFAGRTYYGWLYGTEVMPERGAELQSWIGERNDVTEEGHTSETRWWIGPLIGITDQLELALPVEVAWGTTPDGGRFTVLDRYGAELRYRFVTQDPVDRPQIVPLVRVALDRSVTARDTWLPSADAVVSFESGRVHALIDIGGYGEISANAHHFEIHPGAGVSILVYEQLRLGAEIYSELSVENTPGNGSWAVIGPNLAWSHGRTWLSAVWGYGIYGIRDAPRVQWGIAF